jgi:hypothetical protein
MVLALVMLLSGCVVSPTMIHHDSMAFGEVIEDTTNKLLVVNVLRARDKAPLHFSDIPIIRESMQQSFSLNFLEVMGSLTANLRDTRTANMAIQKSPSFDINHLQSKDFITGISSPIDPKVVKYWLDRGLDRRIALLLFFSAVEIVETHSEKGPVNTIKIMNAPREAIDAIKTRASLGSGELRCDTQSDFERYLKLINSLKTFFAHSYRERRVLANGINLDIAKDSRNLQSFAALDQTKTQLVYDKGLAAYSLYALSPDPKVAFCFYEDRSAGTTAPSQYETIQAGTAAPLDRKSCFQSVVDIPPEDSTRPQISQTPLFFSGQAQLNAPSNYCSIYNRFTGDSVFKQINGYPRLELRLHIRSVSEIFQFLGDLLHYQDGVRHYLDSSPQLKLKLNTPITFGYCADDPSPGCNDVFFRLDDSACNTRFTLSYRNTSYAVANLNPPNDMSCGPQEASRKDHTLEILSVLHQLVNLNKSATDIRPTPSVQVLP